MPARYHMLATTPDAALVLPNHQRPAEDIPQSAQLSLTSLQPSPAAGFVVGDDLLQHCLERGRVDLFAPANGNGAGGLVLVTAGDDPVWGPAPFAPSYKNTFTQALAANRAQMFPLEGKIRLARALDGSLPPSDPLRGPARGLDRR